MLLIKFRAVERFSFLQEFKLFLNNVSRNSVKKTPQKVHKIAVITLTVTKIGYFGPFCSIFGNIRGSFWIQNRPNIGIYILHTKSIIFALALEKRKIPPTYKQKKVTVN